MSLPTPQQFADAVISENDAVCDQLRKLATMTRLISDVYAEIYDSNGDLTSDFLNKVCELSCTGSGVPGGSTTTSTTTTTAAPSAVVDADIYTFQTLLSGADRYSKMQVINGDNFDVNGTVLFKSASAIATIPSNRVVLSAALHPTSGDMWAIHYDGQGGASNTNLMLSTMDKSTGVMSDVAELNNGSGGEFDGLATGRIYRIFFDRSDDSLWFMVNTGSLSYLYTVDTATAVYTLVGIMTLPTQSTFASPNDIISDHDGTFYHIATESNAVRVSDTNKTQHPSYPGYLSRNDLSAQFTGVAVNCLLLLRNNKFHLLTYDGATEQLLNSSTTADNVFTDASITTSLLQNMSGSIPDVECMAYLAT